MSYPLRPLAAGRRRRLLADIVLLSTALVWGVTFVTVKEAVAEIPTSTFLALRFSLAAAVLVAAFRREIATAWRRLAWPSLLLGLFLWGGYTLQTLGLDLTLASRAGFITGLAVILVPLLSAVIVRERPPFRALLGVGLALSGLAFLFMVPTAAPAGSALGSAAAAAAPARLVGDLLVLACTASFALQVTLTGLYSPALARTAREAGALAALQTVVAALLSLGVTAVAYARGGGAAGGLAAIFHEGATWTRPFSLSTAGGIVICGLFASAFALLAQTVAQRFTPPTHTAIILTMEPVFAMLAGWLLLGERPGAWGLAGCLFILTGMLAAELPLKARASPGNQGRTSRIEDVDPGAGGDLR